jgi:hypothetical protein
MVHELVILRKDFLIKALEVDATSRCRVEIVRRGFNDIFNKAAQ